MTEDHASAPAFLRLSTTGRGGFRLEGEDGFSIEASPAKSGWEVAGPGGRAAGLLERDDAYPGGFVLSEAPPAGSGEAARTTREGGRAGLPASLLARDGRLFRVSARGPGGGSFELTGWEVPGAYWIARRDGRAYVIERTVAGRDLDTAIEVLVLFAAEVLDAGLGKYGD